MELDIIDFLLDERDELLSKRLDIIFDTIINNGFSTERGHLDQFFDDEDILDDAFNEDSFFSEFIEFSDNVQNMNISREEALALQNNISRKQAHEVIFGV